MTTTTPNLNLILYNSTTDQSATFAAFRADMAGISGSSNFSKIDTAYGTLDSRVDVLELIKSAILINASFISSNYYEATTSLMTAYTTGMSILLNLDTDSAGTVTLKINALSTLNVMKIDGTGTPVNISGGELQSGRYYLFIYDGTRWVWADATSADQVYHGGTTGNLVTIASDGSISSSLAPATQIATSIDSSTAKTTPADSDKFGILDSAASYVLKHMTWANIKAAFLSYWYSVFDGWIPSSATWTYSSIDGATGIATVNADMTAILQKGMRIAYQQNQALTGYCSFDSSSAWGVGGFTSTDTSMTYTSGKFSNAATFNGTTSKIVVTDASGLKPTGDFTVGVWFKTSNTGAEKTIFQSYSGNTNFAGINLRVAVGNTIEYVSGKNTGTIIGTDAVILLGTTTVTDGNWHYVVVSYKNNFAQIYLDGRLETSGYVPTPAYAATNYVRIGCKNISGTDSSFFNGQIDDLYIINGYALDEKTIYDKYIAATAQGTGDITVQKMGIITNVGAYASSTPITFWGGTDYSLVNSTISNPKYSGIKSPFGFPSNPDKWSVTITNSVANTQSTPTATTWYNLGSISIDIPIGVWNLYYQLFMVITSNAAQTSVNGFSTLSSANNSESDFETTAIVGMGGASGVLIVNSSVYKYKLISTSSKITRYLNLKTNTSTASIVLQGSTTPTIIKAVSSYL